MRPGMSTKGAMPKGAKATHKDELGKSSKKALESKINSKLKGRKNIAKGVA